MDVHEGEHPRIGAVDVIPFVPLGDDHDGRLHRARADVRRADRRTLRPARLSVRQRGARGRTARSWPTSGAASTRACEAEIGQRGREPDFGPARLHPSAGAVAVGARPFLIAYNINLDSDDVDLAKRIARRVRESGGGLPRVQANGFEVREPERGHRSARRSR